uniref:Protein kinase domain-containing protein n=1 Tax=Panagrolaimus sp. ES5 TaxID=591445 RepID=A0AC34F987_9BILA
MTEPKPNQGMKLVLSVKWNKKPHHFIINHEGKEASKYYIERFQFDSVIDLINFYISRKVPVTEKSGACLIHPVPRQDWELYHESIELGKMLGEGAFGAVHIGTLTQKDGSSKKVAVKVHKGKAITKEIIKEICKEARTMRRFKHPNVVAFYGVAIEHEPIMIVMELVSGGALDSYLVKNAAMISVNDRVIFSSGKDPYPGMTAAEVNSQVKQGYRMEAPDNMPSTLKTIMIQHCWPQDPDERWNMTMIRKALEDLVLGTSSKKSRMTKCSEMQKID